MALQLYEMLSAAALLLALATVVQRRVVTCVGLYAAQSLLLAAATAVAAARGGPSELYAVAIVTVLIKVLLIPLVLLRIITKLKIRQDVEPFLSLPVSAAFAVLSVVVSFYVGGRLREATGEAHDFVLPCSIALMLEGLLVMLARIKAIMQIVGLLLMENGIFLIALGLVENVPLMVELGITFDVLVAAIVMGTFVYQIGQTFESIDVDDLRFLKG
ncbi:MAG: hypothetical protein AAB434_04940 [Planctomycetota bacterium]